MVDVRPWDGDVTIDGAGARDLVVVNAEGAAGARVHVNDTGATGVSDELYVNGTSVGELATIGTATSPARGVITLAPASYANTIVVDHRGLERVTVATFEGDDRVAVNAIGVDLRVLAGGGDDDVAVGSNAQGVGTVLHQHGRHRRPDPRSPADHRRQRRRHALGRRQRRHVGQHRLADRQLHRGPRHAVRRRRDRRHRLPELRGARDRARVGRRHVHDPQHAPAGTTTVTDANGGNDTINIRTIDGADDDRHRRRHGHRPRSAASRRRPAGVLTGIRANLEIAGGTGADSIFVDDIGTTADHIGVLTPDVLAGLGMILGGSAPAAAIPSLVQVVEVANAVDGRFRLGIGAAFTDELDFDASAEKVRIALEGLPQIGAGDVAVTKAGTRWTIAYRGALAGAAGRALAPLALVQSTLFALVARPGGAGGRHLGVRHDRRPHPLHRLRGDDARPRPGPRRAQRRRHARPARRRSTPAGADDRVMVETTGGDDARQRPGRRRLAARQRRCPPCPTRSTASPASSRSTAARAPT